MNELRRILADAALHPDEHVDVGALSYRARRRRRTRRLATGVAAAVLGVGGITAGVAVSRNGDPTGPITAGPDQTTTQPPATTGLRIQSPLPEGWIQIEGSLYPHVGAPDYEDVTVATFDFPAETHQTCTGDPVAALERMGPTDAVVSVLDIYAGDTSPRPPAPSLLPPDTPINEPPEGGDIPLDTGICLTRQDDFRYNATSFAENGRIVSVAVGLGLDASPETEAEVLDIVQHIVVEPREADAIPTGLQIDPPLPPNWTQITGPLFPDVSPPGTPPRAEATVATFDVPAEPSPVCDYPVAALERLGPDDAFMSVLDAALGDPSPRPPATDFVPLEVPINLVPEGERDLTTELCLVRQPDFRFNETSFAENGRIVRVFVGIGLEATPETEAQVLDVVNRIVVEPPTNVG